MGNPGVSKRTPKNKQKDGQDIDVDGIPVTEEEGEPGQHLWATIGTYQTLNLKSLTKPVVAIAVKVERLSRFAKDFAPAWHVMPACTNDLLSHPTRYTVNTGLLRARSRRKAGPPRCMDF